MAHDSTATLISFVFYGLFLLFQSILIVHFFRTIYGKDLSKKIKVATISVLLIAWLGILIDLLSMLLNVTLVSCRVTIWLRYNWFIIFEFTLYIFWLVRIYHTFKQSVFEIKLAHTLLIAACLFLICTAFLIITSLFLSARVDAIQLTFSASLSNGYQCTPEWQAPLSPLTLSIIGQVSTLLFNLFFTSLFFLKLGKLRELARRDSSKGSDMRALRLFQLMQKHTLLTLLSVVVMILCSLLFDTLALLIPHISLHDLLVVWSLDRVTKSLCIVLMYRYYEAIFAKLCCCCLKLTHSSCCSRRVKQLFPYFDPDPMLKNQTIYVLSHQVVTEEDLYCEDASIDDVRKQSDIIPPPIQTNIALDSDDEPEPEDTDLDVSPSPIPSPKRPLPIAPDAKRLKANHLRQTTPSQSYSRPLPQANFDTDPYEMCNFLACFTDPQNGAQRYLNYNSTGYQIIPTFVFSEVAEQFEESVLHGVVILQQLQFDRNKFSFLRKTKTRYPYMLAIRLKSHHQHIEDAHKLLKYAEYRLNNVLNSIRHNQPFDYEPHFDQIARDIASGKTIKYGASNHAFVTFNGGADGFNRAHHLGQVSWSIPVTSTPTESEANRLQMHHIQHSISGDGH